MVTGAATEVVVIGEWEFGGPRVFPVNWFYRLTGSHLRVVVLCEMVVLTTRTVRVISCLILLLIHKIK